MPALFSLPNLKSRARDSESKFSGARFFWVFIPKINQSAWEGVLDVDLVPICTQNDKKKGLENPEFVLSDGKAFLLSGRKNSGFSTMIFERDGDQGTSVPYDAMEPIFLDS